VPPLARSTPIKLPLVGVACWLPSIWMLPFTVETTAPLNDTY
jgi:hypothetical protein